MLKPKAAIGSLVLATILSFGVITVALVLFGFGIGAIVPWLLTSQSTETIRMRSGGVPVIMSYSISDPTDNEFRTLDGQPVDESVDKHWLTETSLPVPIHRTGHWSDDWQGRIRSFSDFRRPAGYWYFVRFKERGYFVGIDSRGKLPIGFLGTGGFTRSIPTRDEQFAFDRKPFGLGVTTECLVATGRFNLRSQDLLPVWLAYLDSEEGLIEVNLRERQVRTLLESDQIVSLAIITQGPEDLLVEGDDSTRSRPKQLLAVRYADRVDLIDPTADDPSQAVSYPVPEEQHISAEHRQPPSLSLWLTEKGTLIFQWNASTPRDDAPRYRLTWVEPGGQESRTEDIELARHDGVSPAWLAVVSPGAGAAFPTLAALVMAPKDLARGREIDYADAMGEVFSMAWPALLSTYLASGLAIWLCLRRQRRYGVSGSAMWVAFVAVMGLPGVLGYVWSRRWPPLETCTACGKPACQDRNGCHLCGQSFARPPRLGTEVFA